MISDRVPASSLKVLNQIFLREADIDANAAPSSSCFQQDWVPYLHPPTIVLVQERATTSKVFDMGCSIQDLMMN